MCGAKPLEVVGAAVNPLIGIGLFSQRKQQEKAAAAQQAEINKQNVKEDALRAEAEAIGPAAKAIDLTKEASVYNDIKKNKAALRAGIMGTIKSNTLSSAPTATTQKTTLGS